MDARRGSRSTTGMRFVDTNVLLYAVSTNPLEREKAGAAQSILNDGDDGGLALSDQRLAGCRVLLSENLNDGQDYGGVRVRNPF